MHPYTYTRAEERAPLPSDVEDERAPGVILYVLGCALAVAALLFANACLTTPL